MDKFNKLLNQENFSIVLFSEFINETNLNNLKQNKLDKIINKFGIQIFDHTEFCNVYKLAVNNTKNYIYGLCIATILLTLLTTTAIFHLFVSQINPYLFLL